MTKKPSVWHALAPVVITSLLLLLSSVQLHTSMHIPLMIGAVVASAMGLRLGYSWQDLQKMMVDGITTILPVILILVLVGALMGIWLAAGTVPAMVYYGLQLVGPRTFLPMAFLICAAVSLSIGTAFGTTSTVGLAMLGVGQALGLPLPLVVGAIVSGVYFGDRLSPLGSALNLACAVTETDIYQTMRHMLVTTLLPFLITLGFYIWQGAQAAGQVPTELTGAFLQELANLFYLTPWLLLPPAAVILLAARRAPAIPTLAGGAAIGAVCALIWQHTPIASLYGVVQNGFHVASQNPIITQLLNRGGINGMADVLTLLMIAMAFSGLLEGTGMLNALLGPAFKKLYTTPRAVAGTAVLGTLVAMVSANQSLPIIVMGRALRQTYLELGLHPENLARALLDSASILCPLIPWNLNGLFMTSVLGVAVSAYAPYALFCWLMPLGTIAFSFVPRLMTSWSQPTAAVSADD
jgi:NhaC family Na+:H+ antiporter